MCLRRKIGTSEAKVGRTYRIRKRVSPTSDSNGYFQWSNTKQWGTKRSNVKHITMRGTLPCFDCIIARTSPFMAAQSGCRLMDSVLQTCGSYGRTYAFTSSTHARTSWVHMSPVNRAWSTYATLWTGQCHRHRCTGVIIICMHKEILGRTWTDREELYWIHLRL
jgi:hypothetical protein